MKKLLILTTFLSSLMVSSVANAEWTKVYTSDDEGGSAYVNFDRLKKRNGKLYYWALIDFHSMKGQWSLTMYQETECKRDRFKVLNSTTYSDRMGSGNVIGTDNTPMNWNYPAPGSYGEAIFDAVCDP
jgi:hypothetical protein